MRGWSFLNHMDFVGGQKPQAAHTIANRPGRRLRRLSQMSIHAREHTLVGKEKERGIMVTTRVRVSTNGTNTNFR
jgi:hypothetical protein